MARPESVDAYIASQPEAARPVLERVRSAIRRALPAAEEVISYRIPAYRLPGGVAIFFAGWKQHFSLYPASDALVAALGDDLAAYEVHKGTIRFPLSQPVPGRLIARIAKLRASELNKGAKAKAATKKSPAPARVGRNTVRRPAKKSAPANRSLRRS